ncbi:MAG: glycosyl transferase family 2 [uncultured bacterium]|uniref:Glycosyltransferase 2-like domain-containing protein n=1 Tax=Candidatus Wolfebacteria bacterium GW2011_GWC2_39_22 TaxID=1619013 RepID=A0A0G0NAY0_9BACT|nr:MAG: glycosyl transferase family 2 [uncultured bacterium]KKR12598.1 MAG: hypothetical protein UT41_C0001G0142 [Candidatus Wolfebacteria bacterium GW2011_GWC2_39_22]HBI25799.1 hypothetical protein [Candidatus Wolfebacteria bacterium]
MISIITSLYKSDRYLNTYTEQLRIFTDELLRNNVEFEVIVIANDVTERERNLQSVFSKEKWFVFSAVKLEPLYVTWNRGVAMAKGDIICFWNADDVRSAKAIIDGIRRINEGAELVYHPFLIKWYLNVLDWSIFVKRRTILPPLYDQKEFTRSMHCGPFFLFTKSLYQAVGPFDEQFKIVADFDWCIRAANKTNKFVLSKESAGIFRVDGNGLSSGGKPIHVAENNVVYLRHSVSDKLQEVDQNLMAPYKPESILHDGVYSIITI